MRTGHTVRQRRWTGVILAGVAVATLLIGGWVLSARAWARISPPAQVSPQANTYYVAPAASGGSDSNPGTLALPWETIQHAADTMTAGDTVYIRAGTYAEQVIPEHSGSAGNYITYAAYSGETVTIDGSSFSLPDWETGLFEIDSKHYIRISGLHLVNAGPYDNNCGIFVYNSSHIIIENNYTYNTVSSGIGVWASSNITVDGNEVELACNDGEQECITVAGTDTFEIRNNHIHHSGPGTNGGEGIDAKDGSSNGKIYGNHVHHTNGFRTCLYMDSWDKHTYNIEVYQNILHDCSAGISLASEAGGLLQNIRVYNNVIYHNRTNGFEIGNWGEQGISVRPIDNVVFINNTVYDNGFDGWGGGVQLENPDTTNVVVRNNIFSQNESFRVANEAGLPGTTLTVDHNLLDGNVDDTYEISGTNYVVGDPMFVNVVEADFHLLNTSPAIDSGSGVDAPGVDFDGNARPQGGGYDMGAYEVAPRLTLSSATDPHPVEVTTTHITYTITLQNNGSLDATGVTITSTVPNSTTYDSGGHTFVDPNVVWSGLTVAGNSSIEVSFRVAVTGIVTNGDRLINAIWASSAEGATASIPVNTVIVGIQEVYLPLILKNH